MRLIGQGSLDAPVDRVYRALLDRAVLGRSIPGCERLDPIGPDRYELTIGVGVAHLKGRFTGELWREDHPLPNALVVRATAAGPLGSVDARLDIVLDELTDGRTLLSYDGDCSPEGPMARFGQRILTRAAKRATDEFLAGVNRALAAEAILPIAA
jgi:carbon monoxide dehydrogenase subunit G